MTNTNNELETHKHTPRMAPPPGIAPFQLPRSHGSVALVAVGNAAPAVVKESRPVPFRFTLRSSLRPHAGLSVS